MTIPIQNIYFLLCYAWDTLEEAQVVAVVQDECDTLPDLFARVLDGGVTHLLKRGLNRAYVTEEEETSSLRGKLDVSATLKRNLLHQGRAHCIVDSLSHDVTHNRIIKTTIGRLRQCAGLDHDLRDRLCGLFRRLHEVADIDLTPQVFASVRLHRNNAYYGFLLHICRLVYDNLLIDERTGESRFRDFLRDEKQMAALFEKFVRNFYRREQDQFNVGVETFEWQGVDAEPEDLELLPRMRTDVSLVGPCRKIVIDTKYYAKTMQGYFGSAKLHSGNLYQLFAYLNNLNVKDKRPVEGILLYPTVGESLSSSYRIQGHWMRVATVDLNANWQLIRKTLLGLLEPA